MPFPRLALPAAALLVVALGGCTPKAAPAGSGAVTVTASDHDCTLSATSIRSGTTTFTVKNTGSTVTEFYLTAGSKTLGEVENVGPGVSRTLSIALQPGTYATLCKPGMTGNGVGRTTLRVTDGGT